MAEQRGFQVVSEDPSPPQPPPAAQQAAIQMLNLALKALSQRAVTAVTDLFTLLTAASVFFLFWEWMYLAFVPPIYLVGVSIYAAFIIAINVIVRRK